MVGGNSPQIAAPRIRRGRRILAVGVFSLLGVAATWAMGDDSPSLRTLARHYADPTQLFETEESEIAVDHVVVLTKAFAIPPEGPPLIDFAVDEPPAFVASPVATPRTAAAPAPAARSTAARDTAGPASAATRSAAPASVAAWPTVASSKVTPPPTAPVKKPAAARPPVRFADAEPPAFVASLVATPRTAAAPGPAAPSTAARDTAGPASAATHSPAPASAAQALRLASATVTPPSTAAVKKPAVARPPVRFADAEPPAFAIMGIAAPRPIATYIPAPTPARTAAPVLIVTEPVESPSLMIPPPPALVATAIPDTPSFSPTAEPLNITIGALAPADQPMPPPAPGVDSSIAAQTGEPGSFGSVEKLGDAPASSTLEFLRQQAILLKPGQCQFDWGLNYTVFDVHAAIPTVDSHGDITGVANERERLQLMSIPFAVRYGLCDGLQAYVNAPLGWSNTESTADSGDSHTNNFVGLGDLSAGFNCQIMKGCGAYVPDVIASVGFIAPTGHATFATSLLAPNSALGQGFWDITCSVLAVHTIDPVVFYYGGGYVHRFDASFDNNLEVDPGQEFDYVFGVGFAVNPWVTISGTFIGNYLTRFGVNDVSIPGSDLDLLRFRVSVTVVKDKHICEPFGEIGMTPDSPSRVGVTFTY